MTKHQRREIIEAFSVAVDRMELSVASETDLPYTKTEIRQAIREDIKFYQDTEHFELMQALYYGLEAFISPEDFEVVKAHETGLTQADESLAGRYRRIMEEIEERQQSRLSELKRFVESDGAVEGEFVN